MAYFCTFFFPSKNLSLRKVCVALNNNCVCDSLSKQSSFVEEQYLLRKCVYHDGITTAVPTALSTVRWPLKIVPRAGEDVVIERYMTIILNNSTEKLGKLTILGTLEFGYDYEELILSASEIEVWGTLRVGNSKEDPWPGKAAIISLHSDNDDVSILAEPTALGNMQCNTIE